jgi:hypothetical protein
MRHEFFVEQADYIAELGLMINYDDGFIAYLNGKEVVRKGVGKGSGKDAQQIKSHDATRYGYFPLKDFEKYLRNGTNVLAHAAVDLRPRAERADRASARQTDTYADAAAYARDDGMRAGFEYFKNFEQDAKDFAELSTTKLNMPFKRSTQASPL